MNPSKFSLPAKYKRCATNVWIEYSDLARKYKPLNLGQGAPDFAAPKLLTAALEQVSKNSEPAVHQYTRGFGHLRLVNVLSKLYSPLINHEIEPKTEIMIANGATEALYCAVMGFIEEGDQVIVIEPFFDCYEYLVLMAGGTLKYTPLRVNSTSGKWQLDMEELEGLFNEKTKMIILNTPHNPTGKVFELNELLAIADLCVKFDVLCISDEVYEWMVYEPNSHVRIASLPGMWDRTITIGSAGKTFSITGWKIGWAYGPARLLFNLTVIHQNAVYTCCTPTQEALAIAFEQEVGSHGTDDSYLSSLSRSLETKKNYMTNFLNETGFKAFNTEGGYFMIADWSALGWYCWLPIYVRYSKSLYESIAESKVNLSQEPDKYMDYKFTKWMCKHLGLQVIPLSAFYSEANKHLGEYFVRFCFIKEDANLEKAANILRKWHNTSLTD